MLLETEKYLSQKKWIGVHEDNKTTYFQKYNNTFQIYIENSESEFTVSFPLKGSVFSYKVKFADKKKAEQYLKKIVYNNF